MTAPEGGYEESGEGEHEESSAAGTITQDQLNRLLAKQKSDLQKQFAGPEFEAIKDKAAQFDALTESTKSETAKAQEALAEWKTQAEEAATELAWRDTLLLRQELSAQKGLDPKLWSRVQGETAEEIESDIADLLSSFSARKTPSALKSGASSDSHLTAKERAAQALRSTRER